MGKGGEIDWRTVEVEALPGLRRDVIHDLWRKLHRRPPAKGLSGDLLVRALAWRIQCERHGGVTRGLEQRLARVAKEAMRNAALGTTLAGPSEAPGEVPDDTLDALGGSGAPASAAAIAAASSPASPAPPTSASSPPARRTMRAGTRLVREWQEQVHEVTVMPDGFLWDGKTHRSLSVIAKAITGTSWNGWLFFGVSQKPGKAKAASSPSPIFSGARQTGDLGRTEHRVGSADILSPPSKPVEPGLNKPGTRNGLSSSVARGRARHAEEKGIEREEIAHE